MQAEEWRTESLGEIVDFNTGKLDSNAAIRDGDYPFFTCSQETFRTNTYSFDAECVLLAGNNANGIFPLKYFHGKFDAYQRTYVIRPRDANSLSTRFLYYALRPKLSELQSYSTGVSTKFLTLTILKETKIRVASFPLQQRIVNILSAYDELIEKNQRRIKILETMARALYREWFVNFRYPGHETIPLVSSALGPIPHGWEATTISDISEYINRGISPTYDDDGNSIVINQRCVRDQRLNLTAARKQSKNIPVEKAIRFGDVLINSTGVGTLGRVAQVYEELDSSTADSHITIARANKDTNIDFFGCALLSLQDTFERLGVGATGQTELSRGAIGGIELVRPKPEIQAYFGSTIAPLRHTAVIYDKQNQNLKKTRDLLLPRLMEGKINV